MVSFSLVKRSVMLLELVRGGSSDTTGSGGQEKIAPAEILAEQRKVAFAVKARVNGYAAVLSGSRSKAERLDGAVILPIADAIQQTCDRVSWSVHHKTCRISLDRAPWILVAGARASLSRQFANAEAADLIDVGSPRSSYKCFLKQPAECHCFEDRVCRGNARARVQSASPEAGNTLCLCAIPIATSSSYAVATRA
jgi:hypothetical protein